MKKIISLSLILIILSCSETVKNDIKIKNNVDDRVNILSDDYIKKTGQKLSDFEKKTSVQIVVLFIDSIGKNDLDTFVNEIANSNGIGQKHVNNGILIFLSKDDKKIRINVGCGLEWIISDKIAGSIIQEMIPYLKNGNFEDAIDLAINKITTLSESVSWKISKKSLNKLNNSDINSIFQFEGKKIKEEPVENLEYDNQSNEFITVKTKEGISLNLLITFYRYYSYFINEKKDVIITARLTKVTPVTFQLLGVER
ncbi:TPM domain-containing protein [Leptospira kanakyensis]|nr:TPM domain-containing protein [Leptospira kanakyensis]